MVGTTTNTMTIEPMNATVASAASVLSVAIDATRMTTKRSARVVVTSISPEAIRSPRLAGGRSSATASPVTRSSVVSVANSGAVMVRLVP